MTFAFGRIRYLLIDLDGVLYRGNLSLGNAPEFIAWLRAHDVSFRLVTNNATLTPEQYVSKLAGMGIQVREPEIFTSSLATALYLDKDGLSGKRAFIIGETGLVEALRGIDVHAAEDGADLVVVGLDRHVTYDRLAHAALALQAGARFIGTNPDLSFPSEKGLVPGAGALQAVLTATTGIKPLVIGKPEPLMLDLAMESLGSTAKNTAMLGDRLDTDIEGARGVHMASILVLTGVSTRSDLATSPVQPDLVVDDLAELMQEWTAAL